MNHGRFEYAIGLRQSAVHYDCADGDKAHSSPRQRKLFILMPYARGPRAVLFGTLA